MRKQLFIMMHLWEAHWHDDVHRLVETWIHQNENRITGRSTCRKSIIWGRETVERARKKLITQLCTRAFTLEIRSTIPIHWLQAQRTVLCIRVSLSRNADPLDKRIDTGHWVRCCFCYSFSVFVSTPVFHVVSTSWCIAFACLYVPHSRRYFSWIAISFARLDGHRTQ